MGLLFGLSVLLTLRKEIVLSDDIGKGVTVVVGSLLKYMLI